MSLSVRTAEKTDIGPRRGTLTSVERETVITKAADEKGWTVSTWIPKHARKLTKIAVLWGVPTSKMAFGGVIVTLPEKAVRFAAPRAKVPQRRLQQRKVPGAAEIPERG